MKYRIEKHKVFGIKYGGDVEIPVLKFLYHHRGGGCFYTKTIASAVHIDSDSVRGALDRLHDRGYVKKFVSRKDGRYRIWRIRRNANVYRQVERRIGIYKKNKNPKFQDDIYGKYFGQHSTRVNEDTKTHEEDRDITPKTLFPKLPKPELNKDQNKGIIDRISKTTKRLSPLKTALQSAFPHMALPIEAGYHILSNLDTIRDVYKLTTNVVSRPLNDILSETVKGAAGLVCKHLLGSVTQSIGSTIIPNIVETSSKYLEEKDIFNDVTEALKLDESHSEDFKDFYETSLSNSLRKRLEAAG